MGLHVLLQFSSLRIRVAPKLSVHVRIPLLHIAPEGFMGRPYSSGMRTCTE